MKRQLFAILTAISMLGFTNPAFAASVISKKQLAIPKIDPLVLPIAIRSTRQDLIQEFQCNDTSYRHWLIQIPNPDPTTTSGYAVFEARRGTTAKWKLVPWSTSATNINNYSFISCEGSDVYLERASGNARQSSYSTSVLKVSLASFNSGAVWNFSNGIWFAFSSGFYGGDNPVTTIDGILQIPGRLLIQPEYYGGNVVGDSRPQTIGSSGTIRHTVPWYRDLNIAKSQGLILTAYFYRLHDGYAVREVSYQCDTGTTCVEKETTYYRIINGQAQYSVVESLPFKPTDRSSTLNREENGVTLTTSGYTGEVFTGQKRILVHGLPPNLCPVGSQDCKTIEAAGWVLAESDTTVYVRYLIIGTDGRYQQYWEATVQK